MNKSKVEVSVFCIVFNHAKYLRNCLDSLVNQVTTFEYEILVHDDCSTDGSIEILQEYERNYPNIIVLYENENQYSKGVKVTAELIYPRAKGKYIALCEGDDFWIDVNKLQKQYDFMESHNNCSLCTHNTIKKDLSKKNKDSLFNEWKETHKLTQEDVFLHWKIHTTSFFFRHDAYVYENCLPVIWAGDYTRLLYAFSKGDVFALPDVMSVYNFNNEAGQLFKLQKAQIRIQKYLERIRFLNSYNEYTQYKYNRIVNRVISRDMRQVLISKLILILDQDMSFISYWKANKLITKSPLYRDCFKKAHWLDKLKLFALFHSYILFKKFKNIYMIEA